MRIIIDADACPDIDDIIEVSKKHQLECHLFYDTSHLIDNEYAELHIIEKGFQTVDMHIANFTVKDDIVITQDYGLAALVLTKCYAIDPKGHIYTNCNIEFMLQSRHQNTKSRKSGIKMKGPKKRTKNDSENLILSLENIIKNNKIN